MRACLENLKIAGLMIWAVVVLCASVSTVPRVTEPAAAFADLDAQQSDDFVIPSDRSDVPPMANLAERHHQAIGSIHGANRAIAALNPLPTQRCDAAVSRIPDPSFFSPFIPPVRILFCISLT